MVQASIHSVSRSRGLLVDQSTVRRGDPANTPHYLLFLAEMKLQEAVYKASAIKMIMKKMKSLLYFLALVVMASLVQVVPARGADVPWPIIGPDGGDARRIAADPNNSKHLYLGTVNSWLYQSEDGGANWKRVSKLSK